MARREPLLLILVLAVVVSAGLVLVQTVLSVLNRPLSGLPVTLVTAAVASGLLIAAIGLRPKAALIPGEPRIWSLMLIGVTIIAAAALLAALGEATIGLADRDGPINLLFTIGCVLACAPIYEALTTWNRTRLGNLDPGEALNGFSGVLVAIAIGNLIVRHYQDPGSGLAPWQLQASLWAEAALMVVLGAAFSIAMIAGLLRDPRIWLVITGIALGAVAELTGLVVGEQAKVSIQAVWLLIAALIALCVVMRPRSGAVPDAAAAGQATIFGALVVLLIGVAVLALDGDLAVEGSRMPMLYASAGVLGASVRILGVIQDLSHLSESRREALTDELTGIANRRALLAAIDQALLAGGSTTLLILDLDRFKAINDRYGHEAGDQVLRRMAEAFGALLPEGALLARLGGDEFAVLLTDAGPGVPAALARSLARAAAPVSDVKGRLLQVGASVGVATVTPPEMDGGELLRQADAAMYLAKTSGSGVGLYDGAVDAVAQERLGLVEDLHRALAGSAVEREQIVVYFQPQLDTATGRVNGAEALVRWQHPRLGLLAPDLFIDLAEQNELIGAITARVMREAALQAGRWRAAGYPLRVAVNLSASCLARDSLFLLLDEIIETGLIAADLVLEMTETNLMKDPEKGLAAMRLIADRGVGISIDDYGTGYSSLSYLNDLPATELKIDRSFTARITSDPRTVAIVAGTVELAHRLGMRLVAEGVEDEPTLIEMTRLGCDVTQGYLHSRPLPAEMFLQWLTVGPGSAPTSGSARLSDQREEPLALG